MERIPANRTERGKMVSEKLHMVASKLENNPDIPRVESYPIGEDLRDAGLRIKFSYNEIDELLTRLANKHY